MNRLSSPVDVHVDIENEQFPQPFKASLAALKRSFLFSETSSLPVNP